MWNDQQLVKVFDTIRDRVAGNTVDNPVQLESNVDSLVRELSALYVKVPQGEPTPADLRNEYAAVLERLVEAVVATYNLPRCHFEDVGGFCNIGLEHLEHVADGGY